MIARLTVQRGTLTEYPLAEKVKGGWQNGVTFYPDSDVTKVQTGYRHVGALEALLEWLPSHISDVSTDDVRAALAGNQRWVHLLKAQRTCICTPAIAGISDGPNVDCSIHGDRKVDA